MSDADLLIRCDSLLSLIRHREGPLTDQTVRDLDDLLAALRPRTDALIRGTRPDADRDALARVRALADEWEARAPMVAASWPRYAAKQLRAALAGDAEGSGQ